jgi:hypothetical protein
VIAPLKSLHKVEAIDSVVVVEAIVKAAEAIVNKEANQVTTQAVILEVISEANQEAIQEAKATQEPTARTNPTAPSEIAIARQKIKSVFKHSTQQNQSTNKLYKENL